ncbi:uncharacterized protein LOC100277270 [Zea mays]|uniref:Phosphoethanolamine N-methyltransferase 3 n=1 Tax=Zea mays TaxID=4577 RepID=B6TRY8_MAIZE|nr:uncharacterized protein LOC100277270 [Zea mays]NP_001394117.1 uncharacterized protein LOC100277270 [Zea mays]ACG39871.1 hypothetical protein [Zea mays]ONM25200.1 Phosphoethanolamine N-methyltransferase 3 [Zea mays]ONM25201.1 Phosphoethanolamine N-methyltransferase 3 [Zea mays]ONM25202.1 Phosphoethanolamine N-methyltransferase 3 [Zea mays]ONM25203.1 Phosphoethanolamine N-methyltransferase 3 [Zea mays]|eukprot:NP_001144359.1 uncharacterized protein LOC100277270 [Zea mays]
MGRSVEHMVLAVWFVRVDNFSVGRCREDGGRGEAGAEELLGGASQEPHRRCHDAGLPRCQSRQGATCRSGQGGCPKNESIKVCSWILHSERLKR